MKSNIYLLRIIPLLLIKLLKGVCNGKSLRVLVVSYSGVEGAQLELEQTGCSFEMLLDPQRKIYKSFGLGSSYAKVMKFSCLLQFSEYAAVDRDFPDIPYRLLEDIYQVQTLTLRKYSSVKMKSEINPLEDNEAKISCWTRLNPKFLPVNVNCVHYSLHDYMISGLVHDEFIKPKFILC
uniref:Selenoprotein P N-terminal domain-containing protein n=1 Tax=Anabas testudineus TaxID=64144 RepID=A0A7N6AQV6_ANATE